MCLIFLSVNSEGKCKRSHFNQGYYVFTVTYRSGKSNYHTITTMTAPRICYDMQSGLDINVCPVPVKTDVGQVDLVSWLSDGTSEKMTGGYFL
jgi:hypothetical protein